MRRHAPVRSHPAHRCGARRASAFPVALQGTGVYHVETLKDRLETAQVKKVLREGSSCAEQASQGSLEDVAGASGAGLALSAGWSSGLVSQVMKLQGGHQRTVRSRRVPDLRGGGHRGNGRMSPRDEANAGRPAVNDPARRPDDRERVVFVLGDGTDAPEEPRLGPVQLREHARRDVSANLPERRAHRFDIGQEASLFGGGHTPACGVPPLLKSGATSRVRHSGSSSAAACAVAGSTWPSLSLPSGCPRTA